MRIIRFIDADDAVRWGLEAEGDQASVLAGDLFADLVPTGEQVAVKRLLAPARSDQHFLHWTKLPRARGRIRPRAARATCRLCQAHERGLRLGRPDSATSLLSPRPGS